LDGFAILIIFFKTPLLLITCFYFIFENRKTEKSMKRLRIHYLQHVEYEGLGSIEEWVSSAGHSLTSTRFFESPALPVIADFDWLIIMGGGMSIHDEKEYPWLSDEKKFIRQTIDEGKTVLGICLGSQLVAAALGARVYKNHEKEIGWFDIEPTCYAKSDKLFFDMVSRIKVFHWHGDTFDLPENAIHLAYSQGCKNQAFIYNNRVLALQFHLEPTSESLNCMIEAGREELKKGRYVQTGEEILSSEILIEHNKKYFFKLLDRLAEQ
jgi:GMP synthase-like glutamine amidotransferase